jgi:predicted dehydrogenase
VVSEPTNRLELYGTEGTIIEDHMWEQPLMYASNKSGFETDGWIRPQVEHAPFPGYYGISFRREIEHFVDCVREDREPLVTGELGKAALNVVVRAYESVKTEKIQRVE